MRRIINSIILLAIMAIALPSYGQGLKAFKLKNGLSVYIWEDNTKSDVYGIVACRTGSVNDPAEYTGLAHYLEHVMFKGTDKIGALDWATEKPLYDKIIAKYDEMADEADPVKKEALAKEINELTDIDVSFEPITQGRKVVQIRFKVCRKAMKERLAAEHRNDLLLDNIRTK